MPALVVIAEVVTINLPSCWPLTGAISNVWIIDEMWLGARTARRAWGGDFSLFYGSAFLLTIIPRFANVYFAS